MIKKLFTGKQKKNRLSQRLLYETYYHDVYRKAYFITKDEFLAQDVLQEVFLKAFKQIDTLENVENIKAWLNTVTHRTAVDLLRKKEKWNGVPMEEIFIEMELFDEVVTSTIEKELEHSQLKEQIHQVLDRLSPSFRVIIYLKYIENMKESEIAEKLGIKVGTVKSRAYRAKKELKKELMKYYNLDEEGLI